MALWMLAAAAAYFVKGLCGFANTLVFTSILSFGSATNANISPVDLLVAPGLRRLSWSALGWVLAFPLVWVAYTVVRGPCRSTLSPAVRPSTRTRS